MKKLTSSPTQTLKTSLGIISLLIAAMTFNSCEKEDILPEQQDDPVAKLIPEFRDDIRYGGPGSEIYYIPNHGGPGHSVDTLTTKRAHMVMPLD